MSTATLIPLVVLSMGMQTPPAEVETTPAGPGQPAADQAGYIGEVTGNNVYLRSGPSTNYYTVTKLSAGARLRVVSQEGEWLAVVPPEGCFSLIADTYVDTGNGTEGVVNGDNVRVRAGSQINDAMYAIQLQLSRGAEIHILGTNGKGYYKIAPPTGAKLWVSSRYVERIPDELLALEAASKAAPPGAVTGQPSGAEGASAEETAELIASVTEISREQIEDYRRRVQKLDADLKAELDKPLLRRDLERFRTAFAPLAEQTADDFSRLYAESRIEQITDMMDMIEAVRSVRRMGEQVRTTRTDALAQRAGIRPKPPAIAGGFDVQGELRPSAVFDGLAGPQRYRLVDPNRSPLRTIGYVEIPRGSNIAAQDVLGQLVGVRAREIKLETGNVNPIYIYVAEEIIPLDTAGQ